MHANDVTRTYDGTVFSGHNGVTYEGFVDDDESILTGTLAYGGDAQGAVNAGNYAITACSGTDPASLVCTLTNVQAPQTVSATFDRITCLAFGVASGPGPVLRQLSWCDAACEPFHTPPAPGVGMSKPHGIAALLQWRWKSR